MIQRVGHPGLPVPVQLAALTSSVGACMLELPNVMYIAEDMTPFLVHCHQRSLDNYSKATEMAFGGCSANTVIHSTGNLM